MEMEQSNELLDEMVVRERRDKGVTTGIIIIDSLVCY